MTNARFRARCCVYRCKKAAQCPRGDTRALWHAKVRTSDTAAKRTLRQRDAQQRDRRLALARLAHSATCKYLCRAIRVLSWKHSRQSAVEGRLSKKRRSSEAYRRVSDIGKTIITNNCMLNTQMLKLKDILFL